MKSKKEEIESAFFEFQKMKAFLQSGVTVHVPNVPYAPIEKAQLYVNSLLLIDLIGVFDMAVEYQFDFLKLKLKRRKSKFLQLREGSHIINPGQLEWYRTWRHEAAHGFKRHEFSELNQATEDVARQLDQWGFISGKLEFRHYYQKMPDDKHRIGSRVDNMPILEYEAWSTVVSQGYGATSNKVTDLSFADFKKLISIS